MIKPPTHRIDAIPVFVLAEDDAWDHERIAAERVAMAKDANSKKLKPRLHPVDAYLSGETRYDLGAILEGPDGPCRITDYLRIEEAWQFVLRRLDSTETYSIDAALARGAKLLAYRQAASYCLVRIDGPGAPAIKHDQFNRVENECMESLFAIRASLPAAIGEAGYVASIALRADEKKP